MVAPKQVAPRAVNAGAVTHEEEPLMSTEDRTDPASARAHAITRLHADVDRVLRLERDLPQARRDVEASRRLAAACGVPEAA